VVRRQRNEMAQQGGLGDKSSTKQPLLHHCIPSLSKLNYLHAMAVCCTLSTTLSLAHKNER
jgi:hypothetical protein